MIEAQKIFICWSGIHEAETARFPRHVPRRPTTLEDGEFCPTLKLNQRRMASFLSFEDLIKNFWEWLIMLEMFAVAAWEISYIRECVWNLVHLGDCIFSKDNNNCGVIIKKSITPEKTKIITVDWGHRYTALKRRCLR